MIKRCCAIWVAFLCIVPNVAWASPITYVAALSGLNEAPPNASPGSGFASVVVDPALHTMLIDASFSGLLGTTTASHIHCCTSVPATGTAGVATMTPTFSGFPSGVTSGSYNHLFDLTLASSFNAAFITANGGTVTTAEAALLNGLATGTAYFNIHTSAFPGGEIRGFLTVPDAGSTLLLFGIGLVGLRAWRVRLR